MAAVTVPTTTADDFHTPAAEGTRRQVSLRGLFLCTAYFALSSALASHYGLGIFVLMNGIFLTWLSYRGYLGWMQTLQARPWTFRTSWLLFVISLGLPAVTSKGCNGTTTVHSGWETAVMTATLAGTVLDNTQTVVFDPTQRTRDQLGNLLVELSLVATWNLPNLLILISPWVLYRQQRGKGQVLAFLLGCAALSSWAWGILAGPDLRIGYYVWSLSITAIMLAHRPSRRALAAWAFVGFVYVVVAGNLWAYF